MPIDIVTPPAVLAQAEAWLTNPARQKREPNPMEVAVEMVGDFVLSDHPEELQFAALSVIGAIRGKRFDELNLLDDSHNVSEDGWRVGIVQEFSLGDFRTPFSIGLTFTRPGEQDDSTGQISVSRFANRQVEPGVSFLDAYIYRHKLCTETGMKALTLARLAQRTQRQIVTPFTRQT